MTRFTSAVDRYRRRRCAARVYRLIGAGLLALGLHAFAPSATAQTLCCGLPADWACFGHCDTAGADAGSCRGAGCGRSGWVQSAFTFAANVSYRLEFGVVNWSDSAYQSGLASDGAFTAAANNNVTAPVPEPQTWALMIGGLASSRFVRRRA